jgi:hypothetical protein
VASHLLDTGESRAGDLVAAEGGVDVDEDAGLELKSVIHFE